MKKCSLIVLIAAVMLFLHVGCLEFPGMGIDYPAYHNVHIRNMSTTSGVIFWRTDAAIPGGMWVSVYLDPSPQAGIPVDKTTNGVEQTSRWYVERTIDSVVVDSGTVLFDCEKWLLIEEDNSVWSCTWSNSGW